jgi:hypothetical protein
MEGDSLFLAIFLTVLSKSRAVEDDPIKLFHENDPDTNLIPSRPSAVSKFVRPG